METRLNFSNGTRQKVLLAAVSAVIGLLLAEVLVRLAFPSYSKVMMLNRFVESERGKFCRYDPTLGWDGLENAEDDFEWIDTKHHVRQNRFGYRGTEHPFERTGKNRIVFLGDSFTWGFGVEESQMFTGILERNSAEPLEVVNLGVSGFGTDQEFLLWQNKGSLWNPDRVVLMLTIYTDYFENSMDNAHSYPKPVFRLNADGTLKLSNVPVPSKAGCWGEEVRPIRETPYTALRTLLSNSALANVALSAGLRIEPLRTWLEKKDAIPARQSGYDWEYPVYLSSLNRDSQRSWATMLQLIHMLEKDVRQSGAEFSVVIIPTIAQVYPELWSDFIKKIPLKDRERFDPDAPNRRILQWCAENKIHSVDLLPHFREEARRNPYLYYPVNRHWTPAGQALTARVLQSELPHSPNPQRAP